MSVFFSVQLFLKASIAFFTVTTTSLWHCLQATLHTINLCIEIDFVFRSKWSKNFSAHIIVWIWIKQYPATHCRKSLSALLDIPVCLYDCVSVSWRTHKVYILKIYDVIIWAKFFLWFSASLLLHCFWFFGLHLKS